MEVNYEMLYLWAKQEVVIEKVVYSNFPTLVLAKDELFLKAVGNDDSIIIELCMMEELICANCQGVEECFRYLYETIFVKLGNRLSLTTFGKGVLRKLNVALTQLHPIVVLLHEMVQLIAEMEKFDQAVVAIVTTTKNAGDAIGRSTPLIIASLNIVFVEPLALRKKARTIVSDQVYI
ncbi:hypothetical protein JHK82_012522 [Glycine max]|nr:hypothetical protein JHK82_012522 [Glycine max]